MGPFPAVHPPSEMDLQSSRDEHDVWALVLPKLVFAEDSRSLVLHQDGRKSDRTRK